MATSQNGWLEAWKESRGTRGIALDGEKWCEVLHGPLIFIPDGTAKEDEEDCRPIGYRLMKCSRPL